MTRRTLYLLTALATVMSAGHHLDHLIRGNAVGWPVTESFNAFTASLGIYPAILTGLLLYRARLVGPGFWALLSGGGAGFVAAIHFGPFAVEPPDHIHGAHQTPLIGWLAFAWLIGFVVVLAITSVVETRAWYRERRSGDGVEHGAASAVATR